MKKFVVFFEHDVTLLRKCYIKAKDEDSARIIAEADDFNPFDYENEDVEEICGNYIRIEDVEEII